MDNSTVGMNNFRAHKRVGLFFVCSLIILTGVVAGCTRDEQLLDKVEKAQLVTLNSNGDLNLYPFKDESFHSGGGPIKIGSGFKSFTHYFFGAFNGDMSIPDDLVVRNQDGVLLLYPFKDGKLQGSGEEVGRGFTNFTDYFPGQWDDVPGTDLIVRRPNGDLLFYPFIDKQFHGSGVIVGNGFNFNSYYIRR